MPYRRLTYWEGKLEAAYKSIAALQALAVKTHPEYPRGTRGTPGFRKRYAKWAQDMRARRQIDRKIRMYQETKIPYYKARILATKPTVFDRVLSEDWLETSPEPLRT